MSFASNVTSAFTRVATEFRTLRSLITGSSTGDLTGLTTTAKTSVLAAINELNAKPSGGATALTGLSDVTVGAYTAGRMLRANGTKFVDVDPLTYFEVAGAAAAAQAASQPVDSDLTAIAALTTTAYGRAFLALVNQAGLMALLSQGTTAAKGVLQLATNAQVQTGTDTALATTAAGVKAAIDQRIINDSTLSGGSTVNAPSIASVKAYADALIGANDAMVFKGVIDASTNPNYPAASAGDTYKVSVAGKVGGAAGAVVEVGDILIATVDGSAAGTQATVGANWTIVQVNIDGAVTGPVSATSGNLASFNGTGGKVVQDSGFTPSNAVIGAGSATVLPTSAQVVAYAQPIDSDLTAIAALVTTAFGRSFLALADAQAARDLIVTYSQTQIGDPTTDFVTQFTTALTA